MVAYSAQSGPLITTPTAGGVRIAIGNPSARIGSVDLRVNGAAQCEVVNLMVAPAYRRHGFGSSLMQAAVHQSGRMGASRVILEARPADQSISQQGLLNLYDKLGFQRVGMGVRGSPVLQRMLGPMPSPVQPKFVQPKFVQPKIARGVIQRAWTDELKQQYEQAVYDDEVTQFLEDNNLNDPVRIVTASKNEDDDDTWIPAGVDVRPSKAGRLWKQIYTPLQNEIGGLVSIGCQENAASGKIYMGGPNHAECDSAGTATAGGKKPPICHIIPYNHLMWAWKTIADKSNVQYKYAGPIFLMGYPTDQDAHVQLAWGDMTNLQTGHTACNLATAHQAKQQPNGNPAKAAITKVYAFCKSKGWTP